MENRRGQLPFPIELVFEPLQLCNASCFCCPYTWLAQDKQYRGQVMSRSRVRQLLNAFGGTSRKRGYQGMLTVNPFRFSDPMVCNDLDLVFELAEVHKFNVVITTNGLALTGPKLELLNRYCHRMSKVSISLIGSTVQEIRQLMGLDFNKILLNLDNLAENYPKLRNLVRVSLRIVSNSSEEHDTLESLRKRFKGKGIGVKVIRENWMTNRVDASDFPKEGPPKPLLSVPQTTERFVVGCGWSNHLFQRIEVMVDGSVVLCCDDAEKHKTFGNVSEDGIEKIWNGRLRDEHLAILRREFSRGKSDLICGTCVRAVWSDRNPTRSDWQHYSTSIRMPEDNRNSKIGNEAYRLRLENATLHRKIHELNVRLRAQADPPDSH